MAIDRSEWLSNRIDSMQLNRSIPASVPPALLSLKRSGYGVMQEIARVKQGSALLLSGWVTACVMPKLALVWPWCSYF